MKPITIELWNINDLTYEYAIENNLNPREFNDRFINEYIPSYPNCDIVDICFDSTKELDKSIIDFMEWKLPLGDTIICKHFTF